MNSRTFPENRASEVEPQSTADIFLIRAAALFNLKDLQWVTEELGAVFKTAMAILAQPSQVACWQRVRDD